jgi:hypothetical protein
MLRQKKYQLILLAVLLLAGRLLYGLTSEFWFEDELQIYLIGLKSYATHTWPYYGPDVVYTQTQIPGALQGLLISMAFHICPLPEAPAVLLNLLSFASLSLLAFYVSRHIKSLPSWLIWAWIMTLSWTMDYSTRVVNPSYVLVFSIPFFICITDALKIYTESIIPKRAAFFIMGLCAFLIMQLHLSYVLMLPFIALAFAFSFRKNSIKENIAMGLLFLAGAFIGSLSLIPSWLLDDHAKGIGSNIVFNAENYKNFPLILVRYFLFASYEIPFIMGGSTSERMKVISESIWMTPFTLYLLIFGLFLTGLFIILLFKKRESEEWKKMTHLTLFGFMVLFMSFFFSVKSPSSHTFYLLLPIPVMYSFHCYEWLNKKYRVWKKLMYAALISVLFFYAGLGLYNYRHKSLYTNRDKVVRALEEKNYKLVDERRADRWGYGY